MVLGVQRVFWVLKCVLFLLFFCMHCRGSYESEHTETQQGEYETRGVGEGRKKQWETQTLGYLWKGEGWRREHGVYKLDIT